MKTRKSSSMQKLTLIVLTFMLIFSNFFSIGAPMTVSAEESESKLIVDYEFTESSEGGLPKDKKAGSTLTEVEDTVEEQDRYGNSSIEYGTDNAGDYLQWTTDKERGGGFTLDIDPIDGKDLDKSYSVGVRFSYANFQNNWTKIIDYKNKTEDQGFYFNSAKKLQFYGVGQAGEIEVEADQIVDIIATRDESTKKFIVYMIVDGEFYKEIDLTDSDEGATPTIVDDNKLRLGFFHDDYKSQNKEKTTEGKVYSIKFWDGAVSPAEALEATAAKGVETGTTKITATPGTENTFKYVVSDKLLAFPLRGEDVPTDAQDYTSGADIEGVDATENKYVGVYEVDSNGKVVGFKLITLTEDEIKEAITSLDTTPGGIEAQPVLWLKANDGMISDDGNLASWEDKAGVNNFTLDEPENSTKPTVKANGVNFNPSVKFTNPNKANHYGESAKLIGDKEITYQSGFAVYKWPESGNAGALVGSTEVMPSNGKVILGGHGGNLAIGPGIQNVYDYIEYGNRDKYKVVNHEIKSKENHASRIDGTNTEFTESEFDKFELTPVIGATNTTNGNNWRGFNADVAEIILYDEMTSGDVAKIETYLAVKYGITLNAGKSDYVSTNDEVIWNKETNTGYNKNIAGIGRDDAQDLHQKQSQSINEELQVAIGLTELQDTNAANNASLTDGQYLIWGDNGEELTFTKSIENTADKYHAERVWKAQNTGKVSKVQIAIPADAVSKNTTLLVSDSDEFDIEDEQALEEIILNDVKYYAATVTLNDGDYFTFAVPAPNLIEENGVTLDEKTIILAFDEEVVFGGDVKEGFTVKVGDEVITLGNDAVKIDSNDTTKVIITLPEETDVSEDITVTYDEAEGNLQSSTTGAPVGEFNEKAIDPFADAFTIEEPSEEPVIIATPEIAGKVEPGADVSVVIKDKDGNEVEVDGEVIVDEGGNWTFTPKTDLADGEYTIEVTAKKDGRTATKTKEMTIDTALPELEVTAPEANVFVSRPEFTGTATPGSEVTVKISDDVTLRTTVDEDGNWSVTPEEELVDGDYRIEITAEKDGKTSEPVIKEMTVDTSVTVDYEAEDEITKINPSGITYDKDAGKFTVPNDVDTFTFKDGDKKITATKDADGEWTFTEDVPKIYKSELETKRDDIVGEKLNEGDYTPESWSDLEGALNNATNVLEDSDATQKEVDEALEALDEARSNLTEKKVTPPSVEVDEREYDETPTLTGKSNATEVTIELKDETGKVIETVTVPVNEDGTWSFTPTNPLLSGYYTLAVSATIDGQTVTDEVGVTIAAKPTATVTKPAENTVTTSKPEISGTATPGAKVTVKINDDITLTTTADADGNWSVTPEQDLPEGTNTIVVTAEKEGKTSNPVQKTITVEKKEEPTEPAVDKSLLGNYYNSVKDLEEDNYTPETWGDFATALNTAKSTIDNPDATQDDVNNALNNLIDNHKKLTEVEAAEDADKSALQNMHDLLVGKDLNKDDYTSDSWDKYVLALNNAKSVLDNPEATQEDVDQALTNLIHGYNGLKEQEAPAPIVVDKSKLMERKDEIRNENLDSDDYTTDSWKALDTALNNAAKALDNSAATQKEVDEALTALNKAYDGLVEKPVVPTVDKSKLEALNKEITRQDLSKDAYTSASWTTFSDVQKQALEVLADENATQAEVDATLQALDAAYKGLAEKKAEVPKVDKSKLENLHKDIAKKDLSKDAYTTESWKAFSDAQKQAEEVLADENATQKEVDEAFEVLTKAYDGLAEKPTVIPKPMPEKPSQPTSKPTPTSLATGDTDGEVTGEKLPSTATPIYNQLAFGLVILLTGLLFAFVYRRKMNQ